MTPSRKRPDRYGMQPPAGPPDGTERLSTDAELDVPLAWSPDGQARTTVDYLVGEGKLDRVEPDHAHARAFVAEARRHLESARTLVGTDTPLAFIAAYDAARKSLAAILADQGLRSRGGDGGHAVLLDAVRPQFPSERDTLKRFTWLRTTRNSTEYREPDQPVVTPLEVEDGIVASAAIVDLADRYLRQHGGG